MAPNMWRYDRLKRGLDVISAGVGLVLLSPVLGATALIVRIKLGSPVIFKQERPGLNGEIFELYKFRTMHNTNYAKSLVTDEQRLTNFGKTLRSTSLDELPSLWNVLRGDMSMVGPRPLLVSYLPLYTRSQARRHEVRPGITGLAQVSGRNDVPWEEKFKLDREYVDGYSLAMDSLIIWRTIRTVLSRNGVSQAEHVTTEPFVGYRYDN